MIRSSFILLPLASQLALVLCLGAAGCVNLTPPWQTNTDPGSGGRTTGPSGTGGSIEEIPPNTDAAQEDTDDESAVGEGESLADGGSVRIDGAYDKAPGRETNTGRGGAGGTPSPDAGLDSPDPRDEADDSPLLPDQPVGVGGITGSGGVTGTGGITGSGGVTGTGGVTGSGGITGSGGRTGSGGVIGSGGVTGTGGTPMSSIIKLVGTHFGTGPSYNNDPTRTYAAAFDGNLDTFVDDINASGGYTGIEIATPATVRIIRFFPRSTKNHRMIGGKFQCSNTSQISGYQDLYTITEEPPLAWMEVTLPASQSTCRYLRYLGSAYSYTNVAEIEFWGSGAGTGPGPTDAGAPLTNLSWNRPVMASSQDLNIDDAVHGNDGDLGTKFCPLPNGTGVPAFPDWWLVDLGAVYQVVQTDVNFEKATPYYQYRIEVSTNGTSWTTTANQTANSTRNGGTLTDIFSAQARYVRITITGVSSGTDAGCLLEFLVWGYPTPISGGNTLTNLSVQRPVAFSAEAPTKPAANGNDGTFATGYCPGSTYFPVQWRVDLGSTRTISKTEVSFEQQTSAYKYKIETSTDGSTWTTRVDQSNNTTRYGASLIDTFSASARYVRITLSGVSTPDQGCFWEFIVWGQ